MCFIKPSMNPKLAKICFELRKNAEKGSLRTKTSARWQRFEKMAVAKRWKKYRSQQQAAD